MQAADILEPDETKVDLAPFDVVTGQFQLLRRREGLGVAEIEGQVVDEQLDGFRRLSGADSAKDGNRLELDGLEEWDSDEQLWVNVGLEV